MPRTQTLPRRARGFTLLEIVAAMLIFFLMVTFALWAMSDSYDQSRAAEDARVLRMLAERKLGEIAVFERHHDVQGNGRFDDLPDEIRDVYQDWEWESEVRDVTVFGTQTDPNADYLFESPSTTDAASADASGGTAQQTQKKGDTQMLREIVLRVKAPAEEGEGEMVEIVTYLPQVPQKTAGGAAKPAAEPNR
jgi:type II secretory pathway pseudopilin PulG